MLLNYYLFFLIFTLYSSDINSLFELTDPEIELWVKGWELKD